MLKWILSACLFGFPFEAGAAPPRTLIVATGIRTTLPRIFEKVNIFLVSTALVCCTVLFLVGAFYKVMYAGKEEKATEGKKIMINALIGVAIITGAYTIFRTVLYLLVL